MISSDVFYCLYVLLFATLPLMDLPPLVCGNRCSSNCGTLQLAAPACIALCCFLTLASQLQLAVMILPLWFNDGPMQAATRRNDISSTPRPGHLMENRDPAETSFSVNVCFSLVCLLASVVKRLMVH